MPAVGVRAASLAVCGAFCHCSCGNRHHRPNAVPVCGCALTGAEARRLRNINVASLRCPSRCVCPPTRVFSLAPRLHQAPKGYAPHLVKVWKSWVFTTGQTTRTVSPFEYNVVGSLLRNFGGKLKHKVTDNFWDVAPGVGAGVACVLITKQARASYLASHRS